jgi:hypothetical protein
MSVMPNAPLPRRRATHKGPDADLDVRVRDLELQNATADRTLGVVRHLAEMMTKHAAATVRVYGESILQAIEDPDAWQAAITGDQALPLALAIETAQPGESRRHFSRTISPTLSTFIAAWSDALGVDSARLIGPFATLIVEAPTSDALEAERAWLCADWTIREYPAFWLSHIDRPADARRLLAMAPVRSIEDMESRAHPVLAAIADQVEAELAEISGSLVHDPYGTSAILNASFAALALGGVDAALEASAIEAAVVTRVVDAAQSLWVAHIAAADDDAETAIARFTDHAEKLQASSLRLLAQMIEAGDPTAR